MKNNYVGMTLDGQPIAFADFTEDTTTESETEVIAGYGDAIAKGFTEARRIELGLYVPKLGENGVIWTGTPKLPKIYRCTSRKRYIKLRMSEGTSRNKAEMEALFLVNRLGMSYRLGYILMGALGDSVCFGWVSPEKEE